VPIAHSSGLGLKVYPSGGIGSSTAKMNSFATRQSLVNMAVLILRGHQHNAQKSGLRPMEGGLTYKYTRSWRRIPL